MIIKNLFAVHQSLIRELQQLTNFYHQNKKFRSHYWVKIKYSKAVSGFPFTSKISWYISVGVEAKTVMTCDDRMIIYLQLSCR